MNSPSLTTASTDQNIDLTRWVWLAVLAFFILTIASAKIVGGVLALIIIGSVCAVTLLFQPRLTFYLFLIALFIYIPQRVTATFAVHPFDILLALLIGGLLIDFLMHNDHKVIWTRFDLPFVVLIAATIISFVFAFKPAYSVVPMVRIVIIYLAFRAVVVMARRLTVRRIILFYIGLVTAVSALNSVLFLMSGGVVRTFGPPSLGYETMAMTALPMALAFLLWAERKSSKLLYAVICLIIGFGIIGTQARAPMLAVMIAIPILSWFAFFKAGREKTASPRRTIAMIFLPIAVLGLALIALQDTIFAGALGRYTQFVESYKNPQGTVALRIVLWTNAVNTWLANPIAGIGIGNFRVVHQLYPAIKTAPLFTYVKGMSAHNVILHYLAETGIIGALALVALAGRGLAMSYRLFRQKLSFADNQVSAAIFVSMAVFCITLLYMRAWTWGQGGYIMALLFGLTAAWNSRLGRTT